VTNYDEFIQNPQVYKLIEGEIKTKAKEAGFFGFEIP